MLTEADCPSYLIELLSRYANHNLMCPWYNRETDGGRTFQVYGAKFWTEIPLEIRKKDAIDSLSLAMMTHFLEKCCG